MKGLFIKTFPPHLGQALKVKAAQMEITLTSLVTRIITEWLEAEGKRGGER